MIISVALPCPLPKTFDYLVPAQLITQRSSLVGVRVKVPFGRREMLGIVVAEPSNSNVPKEKLRTILLIVDDQPILSPTQLAFLAWASRYYHQPIGDVILNTLPLSVRMGEKRLVTKQKFWKLTSMCQEQLADHNPRDSVCLSIKLTKKHLAVLELFYKKAGAISQTSLQEHGISQAVLKTLNKKNCLETYQEEQTRERLQHAYQSVEMGRVGGDRLFSPNAMTLNAEQADVVEYVSEHFQQFLPILLQGVTGSGKTQVYIEMAARLIAANKQILVLVPEIGLAPQMLARFQQRFGEDVWTYHSGMTEKERSELWHWISANRAKIVIGTRSATFLPFVNLGLIIIDEEHDASYKQQEGFFYHARDLLLVKAKMVQIPIVLGSATPSLESLQNAKAEKYHLFELKQRAGNAQMPEFQLIDMRKEKVRSGVSEPLFQKIEQHLYQQGQVLLFLNRRGYAPIFMCFRCGLIVECSHCDGKLVVHQQEKMLHCHYCQRKRPLPTECPHCHGRHIGPVGVGTEKLEYVMAEHFPGFHCVRIDRDVTRIKGALTARLAELQSGEGQILIGTQMLAKGHHFPNLTLVALIQADAGLLSPDFRGAERFAQLFTQVAGRAGRAEKPGEVVIQTYKPEHPAYAELIQFGYVQFAETLLAERKQGRFPPFGHLAILRARAKQADRCQGFLYKVAKLWQDIANQDLQVLGPIPAPKERIDAYYRSQILLQALDRKQLNHFLQRGLAMVYQLKKPAGLFWTLDVDPLDMI